MSTCGQNVQAEIQANCLLGLISHTRSHYCQGQSKKRNLYCLN